MKRTLTILTIALVGLSACTRISLAPEKLEKGRQVQFLMAPIINSQTRAESTTVPTFSQDSTFGTTAFAIASDKNWNTVTSNSTSIASDISGTNIQNLEISFQNGVWKSKTGESYYWDDSDKDGKNLTFLSWSPFEFGGTSTSDYVTSTKLVISDVTKDFTYTGWKMPNTPGYGYTYNSATGTYDRNQKDGSVDLLLAKSLDCNEDNSGNGVTTRFVHQLCNVTFVAYIIDEPDKDSDGNYIQKWNITNVTLSGIYTQADLLKTATKPGDSGIWSNYNNAQSYSYGCSISLTYTDPQSEGFTPTVIFPQTLMLPQSVFSTSSSPRKPTITITYTDENGKSQTMSGALETDSSSAGLQAWYAGQSITYRIGISTKNYPIEFSGSVRDWGTGSSTDVNIGS